MANLITAALSSIIFLSLLYYLKLSYPRDHNLFAAHDLDKVKQKPLPSLDDSDNDFMQQAGNKMLNVDLWEQRLAWQRLQTDLILREDRKGQITHNADPQSMRIAIAALRAANKVDASESSLKDLYMRADVDIDPDKRKQAKQERSIEERLVDRMHAAFSLQPDTPHAYNGVQVPFTLEEFRDYIIGFSQDLHQQFKRNQVLDSIRKRRRPSKAAPLPLLKQKSSNSNKPPSPSEDYIVWATKKYLKHSQQPLRLQGLDNDEAKVELPIGVDAESINPDLFKMYSPNTFIAPGASEIELTKKKEHQKALN